MAVNVSKIATVVSLTLVCLMLLGRDGFTGGFFGISRWAVIILLSLTLRRNVGFSLVHTSMLSCGKVNSDSGFFVRKMLGTRFGSVGTRFL